MKTRKILNKVKIFIGQEFERILKDSESRKNYIKFYEGQASELGIILDKIIELEKE
jgi:hypothetical protein